MAKSKVVTFLLTWALTCHYITQVHWEDDKTYGEIAERYARYAQSLGIYDKAAQTIVVFDGYHNPTKDHKVEVTANKKVMISRTKF